MHTCRERGGHGGMQATRASWYGMVVVWMATDLGRQVGRHPIQTSRVAAAAIPAQRMTNVSLSISCCCPACMRRPCAVAPALCRPALCQRKRPRTRTPESPPTCLPQTAAPVDPFGSVLTAHLTSAGTSPLRVFHALPRGLPPW
ncbi:hypothetical protein BS78_04G171800 [Paspalum vaginatum]|nr:hypothetical protein BS78_04G171800 [Paspalum vaginatum]